MYKATWKKGRKTIKGHWYYRWAADRFVIWLDGKDHDTGLTREPFVIAGDHPEFGGWKLIKSEPQKQKCKPKT